jgi:hypothetical protein
MKAITIQQPYASLIACGEKRFETRSWKTNYRGKIAIHAGLQTYREAPNDITEQACNALGLDYAPFDTYFRPWGEYLPTGAIIAVADLVECWHIEEHLTPGENGRDLYLVNSKGEKKDWAINCAGEIVFGNFAKDLYAWELSNVEPLSSPIPCAGKQGFWDCCDALSAAYHNPEQTDEVKAFLRE